MDTTKSSFPNFISIFFFVYLAQIVTIIILNRCGHSFTYFRWRFWGGLNKFHPQFVKTRPIHRRMKKVNGRVFSPRHLWDIFRRKWCRVIRKRAHRWTIQKLLNGHPTVMLIAVRTPSALWAMCAKRKKISKRPHDSVSIYTFTLPFVVIPQ